MCASASPRRPYRCPPSLLRRWAAEPAYHDPTPLVRPYVVAYEQQERRRALALALDGIDVGPPVIHGVRVGGGGPVTGRRTMPCCRCERRFAPLSFRSEEYRSVACRLGQHRTCRDDEAAEPPCEGVTLLRCSCPCHAREP
ncbi:hypothetical protein [Streptomyces pini]|uniref:Uncharacterized protein n=1 Tax=Streptomyces pini TaxID=1520580 RepID=A0A1I3UCD2_9ACTN|nr:hypothetical protein [Streptomyces pini]SFJ80660.1 hypothetical protein SAMN05192584_101410 [Streptomyces pini]